jgi:hypothetical protein
MLQNIENINQKTDFELPDSAKRRKMKQTELLKKDKVIL